MNADRELLELAAKAVAIQIDDWNGDYPVIYIERWSGSENDAPDREVTYWNPLVNDGDALRLAVKLRLEVAPGCYFPDQVEVYMHDRNPVAELFGSDEVAATRRAIVRAAAEIGRAKP